MILFVLFLISFISRESYAGKKNGNFSQKIFVIGKSCGSKVRVRLVHINRPKSLS